MVINNVKQRMTPQRGRILKYLKSVCNHPSAEVIFEAVSKDMPHITLATVYRNLNILSENGEILKLMINGEARFDGDISRHQHCYCKSCGNVSDVFYEDISDYASDRIEDSGFSVDRVHVVFYGRCKKCGKGGKK